MPVSKEVQERREALVIEHMESENRHEFDVTMETFEHPRYELIPTGSLDNGWAFHLPHESDLIVQAAHFITLERLCCPFLLGRVAPTNPRCLRWLPVH